MKRLVLILSLIILCILSIPCFAEQDSALPLFFSFETDTPNATYDNCNDGCGVPGGGCDPPSGGIDSGTVSLYNRRNQICTSDSIGPPDKRNTGMVVRNTFSAREGDNYLAFELTWPANHCDDVVDYEHNSWDENKANIEGTMFNNNLWMNRGDGTEYWIGFSFYIPTLVEEPYHGDHSKRMVGQLFGSGTNKEDDACEGKNQILNWVYGDEDTGEKQFNMNWQDPVSGYTDFECLADWTAYRGTWVDVVINAEFYNTADPNAKLKVWTNGVLCMNKTGVKITCNVIEDSLGQRPYIVLSQYTTGWYWTLSGNPPPYDCNQTPQPWSVKYDDNGFTRGSYLDAIRLHEEHDADTGSYAHVAPAIYPNAPTMDTDTCAATRCLYDGDTEIDTTLAWTVESDNDPYSETRSDPTATFSHYASDWKVCSDDLCQNVIYQSLNDTTNKESWTIPINTLPGNQTVYIKHRYRSWAGDIDRDGDGYIATTDPEENDFYPGAWSGITIDTLGSPPSGGPIGLLITGDNNTVLWNLINGQAEESTGIKVANGTTGNKIYNTTVVNCGLSGIDVDDSVIIKNTIMYNNAGPDMDVITDKTVTCDSNSFQDAGISGSGTYSCSEDFSLPKPFRDITIDYSLGAGVEARNGGVSLYSGIEYDLIGRQVTNGSGTPLLGGAIDKGSFEFNKNAMVRFRKSFQYIY